MLYVTLKAEECPKMYLYLYYWYIKEYFYMYYITTKYNVMNCQFGLFFSVISNLFVLPFKLPQVITEQYNISYKRAYESYCNL